MRIRNFLLYLLVCFTFTSCRTIKQVVEKREIPLIGENKLLKNVEINKLHYHSLFAKRIDITLSNEKGSNNFKASMKIERDSFIQVSITAPLGIEVARVLLTADSIKFADIYHKKYFLADYDYFYEKYDFRLGFECLQKILTNTFFNMQTCGETMKNKRYKLDRTDSGYQLSTLEERALSRKIKKLYKKKRKNKDYVLILQKILIDSQSFRPLDISIEDVDEDMGVAVKYEDFKNFSGKLFPEKVVFKLFSDHEKTNLILKFQKIEFDVPVESNFKISSKYKRMY